ncbi:MAG: hypothetical protein HYV47_02175 [Candidatus Nealsonbacteria bacterium]|nr:hypothetical protein [Candidatus Nealsonbacteria bacterium]
MEKTTVAIFLIFAGCFIAGYQVSAAPLELNWPNSPLGTPLNESTGLTELIKYLYEWGISLGGLAVFIVLVTAGFQYLTSAGNAGKMKEALDRIRSAVIGLALLLGSVLILNTINPQLTELKIPPFPLESGELTIKFATSTLTQVDCQYVKIFMNPDYNTFIEELRAGEANNFDGQVKIGSVEVKGACQLTLYYLRGHQATADNPPLIIASDVSNVEAYGETLFRSYKVVNVNVK